MVMIMTAFYYAAPRMVVSFFVTGMDYSLNFNVLYKDRVHCDLHVLVRFQGILLACQHLQLSLAFPLAVRCVRPK